jgi:hypothetical protein
MLCWNQYEIMKKFGASFITCNSSVGRSALTAVADFPLLAGSKSPR